MGANPAGRYDAAVFDVAGVPGARLPRRAVVTLGGAAAAFVVTGCTLDTGVTADRDDDGTAGSAPDNPDLVAVATAVGLLQQAIAPLRAAVEPTPPMVASLHLHEVHLTRLQGVAPAATQPSVGASAAPAPHRRTVAALRAAEQGLVRQLSGLGQRAESGDLARLLAAMAAATAQRLQDWSA